MPMYKEHLLGGFAAGMALLFVVSNTLVHSVPLVNSIEWLLCAFAGSLFPDIDIKSKGQKLFYKLIIFLILLALYKGHLNLAIYLALFSILPMLVHHRGLFHCTWFLVAFPLGAAAIAGVYIPSYCYSLFYDAAFFIIGAISHLLMDFGIKGLIKMR